MVGGLTLPDDGGPDRCPPPAQARRELPGLPGLPGLPALVLDGGQLTDDLGEQ